MPHETAVSLLGDYWPSLVAFGLFGLLHSIGAREPFKNALARWTNPFFVEHFWRLVYCALSFVAQTDTAGSYGTFSFFTNDPAFASLAVSGGADSTALLHILHALGPSLTLRLHVAHLHHGLRPTADEDARFVARTAEGLQLPCTVERADVTGLARAGKHSLEAAGRLARYDFFARAARSAGAGHVAVAHTRDDQVETVLMRLQQGAPWELLAGMRPRRAGPAAVVIRPLLDASRADIRTFLESRRLVWREDPSNLDLLIPRNRARHVDLPALRTVHPAWPQVLWNLGEAARLCADVLDRLSARVYGHLRNEGTGGIVFTLEALRALPQPLRRRVLRQAASEVTGTSRPFARVLEDRMLHAVVAGRPGIPRSAGRPCQACFMPRNSR